MILDGHTRESVLKRLRYALIYKDLLITSQQKYFSIFKYQGAWKKEGHTGLCVHDKKWEMQQNRHFQYDPAVKKV